MEHHFFLHHHSQQQTATIDVSQQSIVEYFKLFRRKKKTQRKCSLKWSGWLHLKKQKKNKGGLLGGANLISGACRAADTEWHREKKSSGDGAEVENDGQSLPASMNKVRLGRRSARCSSSPGWSPHVHTRARAHALSASVPVLTDTASPLLIVLEQQLWQRLNLLHRQSHCERARARASPDSHQPHFVNFWTLALSWGRKGGVRHLCVRVCSPLNSSNNTIMRSLEYSSHRQEQGGVLIETTLGSVRLRTFTQTQTQVLLARNRC